MLETIHCEDVTLARIHFPTHILHCRDLKMENILLDKKKRNVKIVGKKAVIVYTNGV